MNDYVFNHDELTVMVDYMAHHGYNSHDIAYAVEKPWKFADVLALAVAERDSFLIQEPTQLEAF